MTAPIWIAFPPEVHSTLLSSGPGSAPLLAAAGAWSALSTEYADTADELTGLLGAVQAGAWEGPSAAQYVAAHAPYLSWLQESAAKSTATATLHETAATAYTAALATMPTLGELAANHATHGVLSATNFFGINTIPIAVNEADYARMWVQAATTMTTYQGVAVSALAAVPATTPAPQILAAGADTAGATDAATTAADAPAAPTYPSWEDQLAAWLQQYTSKFAWPVSKALNPNGWPINSTAFVNTISSFFTNLGFSPTLATAIGWAVFHTFMIFYPFIQLGIQIATVAFFPAMVAVAAAGAAGAAGAVAVSVATAVPTTIQPPMPAAAAAPVPIAAPAPTISTAPTSVSHVPTTSAAPASAVAGSASAGPVGGGPGVGFGPTATDGIGAGLSNALYAVGLSGLAARTGASGRSRRKSEEPASDDLDAPAAGVTAAAKKRAQARRRRRGTATDRAYRYEYMDLDQELAPGFDTADPPASIPSEESAGPLGFSGAATQSGADQAAGLATLTRHGLSDGPSMPMMPSTWGHD
jgi:PPE-repeat protein